MRNQIQPFRAAAVQAASVWLDREASTRKACELIAEAAGQGADIVALPESFIPGFPYWVFIKPLSESGPWHARFYENAVDVPGPVTETLGTVCRRCGVVAVVGLTERDTATVGTLYNTNVVIGSDGRLLGRHRKLMPTWGERVVWRGGDGSTLSVFPTEFGALGTLNCGENINTLARFALLAQGERIHVANFPSCALIGARHVSNELYLHVAPHAYEGKLYSIVSSECGSQATAEALGIELEIPQGFFDCISGVVGPGGEWVTPPLQDREGIVYADCTAEPVVQGKLFHDIVGHYNRFDVLRVELNSEPMSPLRAPESRPRTDERT